MKPDSRHTKVLPKPSWIRASIPTGKTVASLRELKKQQHLNTVCESALCPNIGTCWGAGQATFMILGTGCTRDCLFCAVNGKPQPIDPCEPMRVAEAVQSIGLKHVVVTSVTRDDLADGGASLFVEVVMSIRKQCPETSVELLIPDFQNSLPALMQVVKAAPDILGHNMETVPRLFTKIRPEADYDKSIKLLATVKTINPSLITKTGLMVGLGETEEEIADTLVHLREAKVDILTIGQYLRPGMKQVPVVRYYHPDEFARIKTEALEMGFTWVESGPLVRSSFQAEKQAQFFKHRKEGICHAVDYVPESI